MIERAQVVARADEGPRYTYEKRSLLERLDVDWRPVSSEEKIYQVTLIGGLPFNRLVKVQGRELSAEELKQEDAREERFRQRIISGDRRELVARKEALVTPELLDHYDFHYSPPGTGTVDITVTTPSGSSAVAAADRFTYYSPIQ